MKLIADKIKNKRNSTPLSGDVEPKKAPAKLPKNSGTTAAKHFDDGKVRPEYNFAKFADKIFLPYQSKRLTETRTIRWQLSLFNEENSDPKIHPAEILITPEQGGQTGTTTTWKIFLGLVRLWEINGRSDDGVLTFSTRELTSVLKMKYSGDISTRIEREIDVLKSVSYRWTWGFVDENKNPVEIIHKLNMLSEIAYIGDKYRKKHQKFERLHNIVFSRHIRKNLINNRTIPVDFDTFVSIKSGTSLTLYSHLCTVLSNKTMYKRTATNLFSDLELVGKKYEKKYVRKEKLEELKTALDGKIMANGILRLSVEETADGKDWNLVARREPIKKTGSLPWSPVTEKEIADELTKEIIQITGQGGSASNWHKIALLYDAQLVQRAISEFRADVDPKTVENTGKLFNAIVHRLAHLHGKEWIRKCGADCKHRA